MPIVDQTIDRTVNEVDQTVDRIRGTAAAPPMLTPDGTVLHIARRCTFGPTPEVLADIAEAGPTAWIEAQLRPDEIDDTRCDAALTHFRTLDWPNRLTLAVDERGPVIRELRYAPVLRATLSNRQLFEVMVDFWTNHFNVYLGKGRVCLLKGTDDRDVIRPHALGRFADLLRASATSPAMLEYLDNARSRATSPNENYGRELLELHTLGVDAGYSEADVRAAAYVLTGWTWDRDSGRFRFRADWHAGTPQQVMDWSTPGHTGAGAVAEGESLLDHLAHHPATARHLARKLAVRFVADDPTDALVEELAHTYLASGTDISAVLRKLFASADFADARTVKLRRPLDLVVSQLRATRADLDPHPEGDASKQLDWRLRSMAQRTLDQLPPTGYPDTATAWIGTDALIRRWSFPGDLVLGRVKGVAVNAGTLHFDPPEDVGALIDAVSSRVLFEPAPTAVRNAALAYLGRNADDPVTDDDMGQVPALAALVLGSPRAQYR